jgi:hypothetical protein
VANLTFSINGIEFKHYSAQDSHRTRVDHYYVNGQFVDYPEFMRHLSVTLKDAERTILMALGASRHYHPSWEQHAARVKIPRVDQPTQSEDPCPKAPSDGPSDI